MARAWFRDVDEKGKLRGLGTGFIVLDLLLRQGIADLIFSQESCSVTNREGKGRAPSRWVPRGRERRGGARLSAAERREGRECTRSWAEKEVGPRGVAGWASAEGSPGKPSPLFFSFFILSGPHVYITDWTKS